MKFPHLFCLSLCSTAALLPLAARAVDEAPKLDPRYPFRTGFAK